MSPCQIIASEKGRKQCFKQLGERGVYPGISPTYPKKSKGWNLIFNPQLQFQKVIFFLNLTKIEHPQTISLYSVLQKEAEAIFTITPSSFLLSSPPPPPKSCVKHCNARRMCCWGEGGQEGMEYINVLLFAKRVKHLIEETCYRQLCLHRIYVSDSRVYKGPLARILTQVFF